MSENSSPTPPPPPSLGQTAPPPPGGYAAPGVATGYAPPTAAPSAPPYAGGGSPAPEGPKSFVVTWLLSWLLGFFAVDRFYLGKIGTGLIKLFTFSGFGVWWLIDLILVLAGAARDKQGYALSGYHQHKKIAWIVTGAVVVLGVVINAINGANAASSAPEPAAIEQPAVEEEPAEEAAVVVPVLTGVSVEVARDAAALVGLSVTVPDGTADDAVVETQSPAVGEEVPEGTAVALTVKSEEPAVEEPAEDVVTPLGTAADVDGMAVTVTAVETGVARVGDQYLGEDAQGQFVLVHLAVSNTGTKPDSFNSLAVTLFDEQGREFSSNAGAAIYLENGSVLFEEINPGNTLNGTLVFDVPADAVPATFEYDPLFGSKAVLALK